MSASIVAGDDASARGGGAALVAATIGCGLEFYDFVTFAFFARQIGAAFFPSADGYVSLMGSLAAFWAGFLGRPVGALVLGRMADRVGRRAVMLLSMLLMGGAITVLALTPGYARIGVAAPVIVVCARVVQGFALGGEVGASTVYLVEAGSALRRGWNASLQGVAQYIAATAGALVGLALSAMLTEAQTAAFGWRIALLLGASVAPFAIVVRRSLPETGGAETGGPETGGPETGGARETPAAAQRAPQQAPQQALLGQRLASPWRVALLGAAIMASGTIATYFFDYAATFGETELHLSTRAAMVGQLAANAIGLVGCLAGGWLTDRWGRRALMVWPQLAFAALLVPAYAWLLAERTAWALVVVNLGLGFISNLTTGAMLAAIAESLDTRVRGRAFSLIYALPVAVFGGGTQWAVTWLLKVTGQPMAVAWALTAVSLGGAAAMIALPESAPGRARVGAVAEAA
jgi:MFS family permease